MKQLLNNYIRAFKLWGTANWYQGLDKPNLYQWAYKWRVSWKTAMKIVRMNNKIRKL